VGYFKTHIPMLATLIVKPEKARAHSLEFIFLRVIFVRLRFHVMASEPFIILRSYWP